MNTFLQHHLLSLLEYRDVLGALATSIDGLVVATAAVDTADAELIAASMTGENDRVTVSEHGALYAVCGSEMRLIVLAEPGADDDILRELMERSLEAIEESVRV